MNTFKLPKYLPLSFFFFRESFFMERPGQRIGADGPSAPRGPAEPGAPEDDNAEKERLRKRIRKAFVQLLRQFFYRYCKGMGFCAAAGIVRGDEKGFLFSGQLMNNRIFFISHLKPMSTSLGNRKLRNFPVK